VNNHEDIVGWIRNLRRLRVSWANDCADFLREGLEEDTGTVSGDVITVGSLVEFGRNHINRFGAPSPPVDVEAFRGRVTLFDVNGNALIETLHGNWWVKVAELTKVEG